MWIFLVLVVSVGIVAGEPRIKVEVNMNNVYGYITDPGKDVGKTIYLGKFQYTDQCIEACLAQKRGKCLTFTFHTPNKTGIYAGTCYGGIDYPMWSPFPDDNVNCGRVLWPCETDMDCSLNGACVEGGCQCRPAWSDHRCGTLNLLPVVRGSGYHYMEDGRNISSWGGGVLRADDGTYHMYAAEMANHCGISSWVTNSQVIHAMSHSATGTYTRQSVVRKPFAHEPTAVKGPNGEFVLYWTENHWNISLCNCSDGSTTPGCKGPSGAMFYTLMSYTMNPNGPWSTPVPVVEPNPRGMDTNFAPVIHKDGSLVGFTRWAGDKGGRMHLVSATNWKDPSTYKESHEDTFPLLGSGGAEDPYMYMDREGNYHAILHNMFPGFNVQNCGGHVYSKDGKHWVYGGKAWDNNVVFTDGATYSFSRRERPHFVFGKDGFTPVALTTSVNYGGKYGDASYTLLQPIVSN